MGNEKSPDEIKQHIVSLFDRVAAGYEHPAARFFTFAADRLVTHLQPRPGQKILDIAAGTGVATRAAAQAVGPAGRVYAIDLSENMLHQAEKAIRKMALANVDLHVMDAEVLEFRRDYFDATVCSFGLFFLPDMLKGLKEWVRVTKPGGRIMFTSYNQQAFQPMTKLLLDRLEQYGVEIPADRSQIGWYRLATPEQGRALLDGAGLVEGNVQAEQLGYHLQGADEWWEIVWNAGFRGFVDQVPVSEQDRFRQEHLAEIEALKTDKGIWLNVEVLFFGGTKPPV